MKATGYEWSSLGALLGLLAVFACQKPSQDAGPATADPGSVVLARVGDKVITVEDLGFVPARVQASSRLEEVVTRRLAAEEARRRGLADAPMTRAKIAEFRRNELMWEEGLLRNALFNSIRLGYTFSEEELRSHFEQIRSRYTEPQWKLRIRKFASEAEARAAEAALGATGRLDPAQSESLVPVPAEELPPEVQPVLHLFKQPGDRQVLDLSGSWSVVELDAYLAAAPLPFERVRQKVDDDLRAVRAEEIMNGVLDKLRDEQVVIDEAAVANLEKQRAEAAAAAKPQ